MLSKNLLMNWRRNWRGLHKILYTYFEIPESAKLRRKKMKILRTKTTVITFVLLLTFAVSMVALPIVSAHDPPWEIPAIAYAVATPNPVGVNQETLIVFWPNFYPITAVGAYGDRYTWNVEIRKDGDLVQTIGPITSDPVGGGWTQFTPTEVGTYTIVAILEEHLLTGEPVPPAGARGTEYIGDTVLGDTSEPVTLVVQVDPVEAWRETPLPTEYWTRPINGMNRNWWPLAGNWLAGSAQNVGPTSYFGYGPGPESAHIMWSSSVWAGGIMDARFEGPIGYATYHYEGVDFVPPIIIDGKLFYNVRTLPREGWRCLDLYTGEELYFRNTTGPVEGIGGGFDFSGVLAGGLLSFGQIYNYESPNQHGGMPYLWSTGATGNAFFPSATDKWDMYDAYTGNYICSIANVSASGTQVYGKDGSILYYRINNGRLTCWNTSRAIWYEDVFVSNNYWMWRPTLNMTFDGNNGFSLNVSVPSLPGGILAVREGQYIIGGTGGQNDAEAVVDGTLWAISLEEGQEGTKLWQYDYTPPRAYAPASQAPRGRYPVSGPYVDPEDGVFHFFDANTLERWGYDLATGNPLWGPTDPEPAMNYYGMPFNVYDGKLLSHGYGGTLIAYNITTGDEMWRYEAENVGFESPYGNYPISIGCIADGKIYLGSGEHSPTQPIWRGPNMRCIDADTGNELWKISFHGASMPMGNGGSNYAISDGYLVGLNGYDLKLYCIGKGPSATTVSVQNDVIAKGDSVMITGMVTDEAAGTKQHEQAARFPNGVPAIADEDQEDWMEYVYMQQEMPMNARGVDVTLEAFDESGNYVPIGTATSDASGFYSMMWTPENQGKYIIVATFQGSKSYYASYAETAIGVGAAPEDPDTGGDGDTEAPLFTTAELVIIAALVVLIIIGLVILLKKK